MGDLGTIMDPPPIDTNDYSGLNAQTDIILEGIESLSLEEFKLPTEANPKSYDFTLPPPPVPLDLNIFSKTVSYKRDSNLKSDSML